jgi:hypothetical protein
VIAGRKRSGADADATITVDGSTTGVENWSSADSTPLATGASA